MKKWDKNLKAYMGWSIPSVMGGAVALWPTYGEASINDDLAKDLFPI